MAVTYTVSSDVLTWMLNQARNNVVASKYIESLEAWKAGIKKPTFNQIQTVSNGIHVPLGYFFLSQAPIENIPLMEYRTIPNAEQCIPSRELIDTIDDMEQIIDWTREYLVTNGNDVNHLVGKVKGKTDVQEIVAFIRHSLGLKENWFEGVENSRDYFKRLRERISEAGVLVMMNGIVKNNTHRPLELSEFRAFAIIDDYAPLIFINASDSPNGRLFSLLHEFTHICLGINNLYNADYTRTVGLNKIDALCNAVAAEILVPEKIFHDSWVAYKNTITEEKVIIDKLSAYFKCSSIVIARKALENNYISKSLYDLISKATVNKYIEQKSKNKGGGNYYLTMGTRLDKRFFNLIFDSVSQGNTGFTEAFRLTNTNRNTFNQVAEALYV